jgi:predicted ribonuclease toxin of YeeF-YezG toxin-antitoxin module
MYFLIIKKFKDVSKTTLEYQEVSSIHSKERALNDASLKWNSFSKQEKSLRRIIVATTNIPNDSSSLEDKDFKHVIYHSDIEG